MSKMVQLLIPASFVLSVCLGQAIAGITMIEYTETFLNGETFTDSDSSPLNSASVGGDPLDGGGNPAYMGLVGYGASSSFAIGNFTELKTSASAFVRAEPDDPDNAWKTIDMTATAISTLTAFGTVENTGGATDVTVRLTWAVEGMSNAMLSNVMNATVDLESTTTLKQTSLAGDQVFTASATDDGATEIESLGNYEIDIPWSWDSSSPPPDIPVFFELKSQLTLSAARNSESDAGFHAEAAAKFGNTAVLDLTKTVIFGPDGTTPIPGATFRLTPVPEPNSTTLFGLMLTLAGYARWSRVRTIRKLGLNEDRDQTRLLT